VHIAASKLELLLDQRVVRSLVVDARNKQASCVLIYKLIDKLVGEMYNQGSCLQQVESTLERIADH